MLKIPDNVSIIEEAQAVPLLDLTAWQVYLIPW